MAGTAVLAVRLIGDAGQLATPIEQLAQRAMGFCCDAGKRMEIKNQTNKAWGPWNTNPTKILM